MLSYVMHGRAAPTHSTLSGEVEGLSIRTYWEPATSLPGYERLVREYLDADGTLVKRDFIHERRVGEPEEQQEQEARR